MLVLNPNLTIQPLMDLFELISSSSFFLCRLLMYTLAVLNDMQEENLTISLTYIIIITAQIYFRY